MTGFVVALICRAFVESLDSIGESPAGIVFASIVLVCAILWRLWSKGWSSATEHVTKTVREGLGVAFCVWVLYFVYCVYRVPIEIREQDITLDTSIRKLLAPEIAHTTMPVVATPIPQTLSEPSFLYVIPTEIQSGPSDSVDFGVYHHGVDAIKSVDLTFWDAERENENVETQPIKRHYDVVKPIVPFLRGTEGIEPWKWKPREITHQHYSMYYSCETGMYSEDLWIEKKKYYAVRISKEYPDRKLLLGCRDPELAEMLAKIKRKRGSLDFGPEPVRKCFPKFVGGP